MLMTELCVDTKITDYFMNIQLVSTFNTSSLEFHFVQLLCCS